MKRYIILRVGKAVLTIWAVYTLVFFLTPWEIQQG